MRFALIASTLVIACTPNPRSTTAAPVVVVTASASASAPPEERAAPAPSFVSVSGTTLVYSRPRSDSEQAPIDPPLGDESERRVLLLRLRASGEFVEVSPVHREVCGGSSVSWAEGTEIIFYVPTAAVRPAADECWAPPLPAVAAGDGDGDGDAAAATDPEWSGLPLRRATEHVPAGKPLYFPDGTRIGKTTRPQPIIGDYEQQGELLCDALGGYPSLCYRITDIVERPPSD